MLLGFEPYTLRHMVRLTALDLLAATRHPLGNALTMGTYASRPERTPSIPPIGVFDWRISGGRPGVFAGWGVGGSRFEGGVATAWWGGGGCGGAGWWGGFAVEDGEEAGHAFGEVDFIDLGGEGEAAVWGRDGGGELSRETRTAGGTVSEAGVGVRRGEAGEGVDAVGNGCAAGRGELGGGSGGGGGQPRGGLDGCRAVRAKAEVDRGKSLIFMSISL